MSDILIAEFETTDDLVSAARAAARAGHPAQEALCPHYVEDVAAHFAPALARAPIGWVMFLAGALGAAAGYFMQWYSAVIDYPINSGGRPLNSWPAFLLVPYETAILLASVCGILAWLWMCGLPALFHPLFSIEGVDRASQDRYLLIFRDADNCADWISAHLSPCAVHRGAA